MPSRQLLDVLDQLQRAVVWIRSDWEQYKRLYLAPNTGQIYAWPLLMEADEYFFHTHCDLLADHLILSISRITDPAQSMNRDNCTLRKLHELIEQVPLKCPRLDKRLDIVDKRVKVFRKIRNQCIAHIDLETRLDESERAKKRLSEPRRPADIEAANSALSLQDGRHEVEQILRSVTRYLTSATKILEVDDSWDLNTGVAGSDGSLLVETLNRLDQLEEYYHLKEFGKPRRSRTVDDKRI